MNWNSLPLNTSKMYITATLKGDCDIFVPVEKEEHIDKVKKELQSFIEWQTWDINHPGGNNLA